MTIKSVIQTEAKKKKKERKKKGKTEERKMKEIRPKQG